MGENLESQVSLVRNSMPSRSAISGEGNLVLVVAKHNELPNEAGQVRCMSALMDVDPLDIGHRVEIATHAINPVGLRARAVDRARHDLRAIPYQSFESLLLGVVQIDPVLQRDRDPLRWAYSRIGSKCGLRNISP